MIWHHDNIVLEILPATAIVEYQDTNNNRRSTAASKVSVLLRYGRWQSVDDLSALTSSRAACQVFGKQRLGKIKPPVSIVGDDGTSIIFGVMRYDKSDVYAMTLTLSDGAREEMVAILNEVEVVAFGFALGKAINALRERPNLTLPSRKS
jgi:hypothetical protein